MIEIDGSLGEGGGQVLRTALTLSALTGQAFHLFNIRAGRKNPGLAPQHLTSVRATAAVCQAEVRGASERSKEIWFAPGSEPRSGEYRFDVREAAQGGSAGAASLIFQTVLLPLLAAEGESRLTLRGGTHVPWSPAFHYLRDVYLPALRKMGAEAEVELAAWGFYPVGEGEMRARVKGSRGAGVQKSALARPFHLSQRGELMEVSGLAVACNLPSHIPQRIADRARSLLKSEGLSANIRPERVRGAGPGAGLFLTARYQHVSAGFSALGQRGKPSETVAEEACRELLAFHRSQGAAVDLHLSDQILLPCAVAPGQSEYTTSRVTAHLLTNAEVIGRFLPVRISIEGSESEPGVVRVEHV